MILMAHRVMSSSFLILKASIRDYVFSLQPTEAASSTTGGLLTTRPNSEQPNNSLPPAWDSKTPVPMVTNHQIDQTKTSNGADDANGPIRCLGLLPRIQDINDQ